MSSSGGFLARHFPTFRSAVGCLGWPILLRQLRGDFRKNRFFLTQLVCLSVLGVALILMIAAKVQDRTLTATQIGQSLFSLFFSIQYLIILVIFPAFSATAFTEERAERTMDLLLTSTLRADEIVWGKFLASSIYCIMYVVASIPLLSVTFLFGGVKLSEVLVAYAILVGLTLLVSMLGVCVSSFYSANLRSTLTVYALMTGLLVWSLQLHEDLQARARSNESIVASLISWLDPSGQDAILGTLGWLAGGAIAFAYLFTIAVNRIRPRSHDRSSALRALTLVAIALFLAVDVAGLLHASGGVPPGLVARRSLLPVVPESRAFPDVVVKALVVLLLVAFIFPAEEAEVSPRNRRSFGRLRGILLPGRIFSPGCAWGFVYTVLVSLLVCGGLLLAWQVWFASAASPQDSRLVVGFLCTIPPYVGAFAGLGFLLSASDFTPLYSRLTVFFLFLISLLLPVIFMVSKVADAVWTLYYLSPVTLWASLCELPPEQEPRFVLFGLPVIQIAQALFTSLTVGLGAGAVWAARRGGRRLFALTETPVRQEVPVPAGSEGQPS